MRLMIVCGLACILLGADLRAHCLARTPEIVAALMSQPGATVFRGVVIGQKPVTGRLPGTVGEVSAHIVSLRVSAVWKGEVPREAVLYFRDAEPSRLGMAAQHDYLVFAFDMSAADRQMFGVPSDAGQTLLAVELGCGAVTFDANLLTGRASYPPK